MPATLSGVAPELDGRSSGRTSSRPSLFILSLPRSLSSLVHGSCCTSLDLRAPAWTTDGEIMNVERSVFLSDRAVCAKYTQERQAQMFGAATEFLNEIIQPRGFCYKDVTQPFIATAWLRGRTDVRVLKILPNITHSAYAMLRRNWLYPVTAAPPGLGDMAARLVAGLTLAAEAIAATPGETVMFESLLSGPASLEDALHRLYPEMDRPTCSFGHDFARGRAEVLARRDLPDYRALDAVVTKVTSAAGMPL